MNETNSQSVFSPLNLKEDASSKKELDEDHTREIEIENAFLTYQRAISLQESGDLVAAYSAYQDLSASSIISSHYYEETDFIRGIQNGCESNQTDELSYVALNVKNIRYLYLRNRGFLHLSIMRAGPDSLAGVYKEDRKSQPKQNKFNDAELFEKNLVLQLAFVKEIFYTMLDSLVSCMMYQEADDAVLRLLIDIYTYLDFRRLAKFTLELAQSLSAESDDIMSILPINKWATTIRETFNKWQSGENSTLLEDLDRKLAFLKPIKDDLAVQIDKITSLQQLEVPIKAGAEWADVFHAVDTAVKQIQDREKLQGLSKYPDLNPYLASEFPSDHVRFKLIEDSSEDVTMIGVDEEPEALTIENVPSTPVEDKPLSSALLSPSPPPPQPSNALEPVPELLAEKTAMRISRRLNPDDLNPITSDDILLSRLYFVETEAFFEQLNALFGEIHINTPALLRDVIDPLVAVAPAAVGPLYLNDFFRTLNEWKTSVYDRIIFHEKLDQNGSGSNANSDKVKLIEVLTRFGNHSSDLQMVHHNLEDVETSVTVLKYLNELSASKLHISLVKKEILCHVLQFAAYSSWLAALATVISDWVNCCELELYVHYDCVRGSLRVKKELGFVLSLYELLIDQYISLKKQVDDAMEQETKAVKNGVNTLLLKLLLTRNRIQKWELLLKEAVDKRFLNLNDEQDASLVIRFFWTSNYLVAAESRSWSEKKYVVSHLQQLLILLNEHPHPSIQISFPNYACIGEFSLQFLHRRLSTASILAIFSKILDSSDLKFDANDNTIVLLENILTESNCIRKEEMSEQESSEKPHNVNGTMGDSLVNSVIDGRASLDEESLKSVRKFLDECPVELRLNLWNILFLYYRKVSFTKYQQGLEQYMEFMFSYLDSSNFSRHLSGRSTLLLQLVSSFDGYLKIFLKYLATKKWILPSPNVSGNTLLNLARVFELSYCFSLHEESALITGCKISLETKSPPAYDYFRDLVIDSVAALLVYLFAAVRRDLPEKLEWFISTIVIVVHNQLGIRRLCDSSNGLFLRFAEDVLVNLQEVPDKELAQILSCRFHYKVKLNGQFPVDHYTEIVGKLDKVSAQELSAFILPFCFRKNPLTHNPRNDLKQVVEDLYEVIGYPDLDRDEQLANNVARVELFCEQNLITPRFIKEAFYGLKQVVLLPLQENYTVACHGLYFMQAVLMFNFYKIRKKSAQSRIVELEKIVSLLNLDLAHGSDRVESWILLGQAYGFLVEDDLIWTSDKLNAIDRKLITANSQRKALVSYLMAISAMTRKGFTNSNVMKDLVAILMSSFTKELYSACLAPMSMTAFLVYPSPRLVRRNGQATTLALSEKPVISHAFCLLLMCKCITLSIRCNDQEWLSFYYLAKIRAKMGQNPLDVLLNLTQASSLARKYSVPGDLILEPGYKYFDLIYKYVKSDQLDLGDALDLINKEPMVKVDAAPATLSKDSIYVALVNSFSRLMALDKKGWYHKPSYRQAYIVLNEFNDLKKAKEIMSKYFSLKASSKTFLQMWKPENERAGKHFVYMYQYTRFYITVLTQERDLSSLISMFPKLRKANSTMVHLYYAWDHMCSSLSRFVRQVFGIEENSVEKFLSATSLQVFTAKARVLVDSFTPEGVSDYVRLALCSLNVVSEMRKLNNGFGSTSLIDDTFIAFFLIVFDQLSPVQLPPADLTQDSPNGKVKRLAKKDLFPFATELTVKSKRFTDTYLKDHPRIFNEYVAQYEQRVKQLWAMQQIAEYKQHVQMLSYIPRINFEAQTANQWWLFEQKLSMKKMLFSTIPDSRNLIQEDQNEIMELPFRQMSSASFSSSALSAASDQRFAMAHGSIASLPNFFQKIGAHSAEPITMKSTAQLVMQPGPIMAFKRYLKPVDEKPSPLPEQEIPAASADASGVSSAYDFASTEPSNGANIACSARVDGGSVSETVSQAQSKSIRKTRIEKSQPKTPEPNSDIVEVIDVESNEEAELDKNDKVIETKQASLTGSSIKVMKVIEPSSGTEAENVQFKEPKASQVGTKKGCKVNCKSKKAAEKVLHTESVAIGLPVLLKKSEIASPVQEEEGTLTDMPIVIDEPIFVPRRRSSRQRENLLKNRLNGLSKDVPIVVEIEDDGPKRSKSQDVVQPAAKRKKSSKI